jgi:hypothetical protein
MRQQQLLLCLAIAAVVAVPAAARAQTEDLLAVGAIKHGWLSGASLGLAVRRNESRLPCQAIGGNCEEVSLVGRAGFAESPWALFGRVGSTTGARTHALGAEAGFGLTYGAGLSWYLSPRTTATVGWDSYDLRLGGTVRATSLGVQWRY